MYIHLILAAQVGCEAEGICSIRSCKMYRLAPYISMDARQSLQRQCACVGY